jgi:hypothetical protein
MPKKSDIRECKKYSLLLGEKAAADEKLKKVKAELIKLEPQVLDYFQRQGIDQISAEGRILFLRREVHTTKTKDVTSEQACEKLIAIGLPDYAGKAVNIKGLGAYVRELEKDGQELMAIEEQFGGAFRIVEIFKIGARKR